MKTLKDYFDKIYVLNYIEAKERRENILKQLDYYNFKEGVEFSYGMPFNKIRTIAPHFEEIGKACRYNCGNISSMACSFNHYSAIKTAYELGANSVLILEDDIIFRDDRDLIIDYLDNIPKDWDYLFFDVCFRRPSTMAEDLLFIKNYDGKYINLKNLKSGFNFETSDKFSSLVSSGAYALNRKAMELYINIFEKSSIMVNSDMLEYFYHNIGKSPLNSYTTKDRLFAVSNEINSIIFDKESNRYIIKQFLVSCSADVNDDNFKFKIPGTIIGTLSNNRI